MGEKGEKESEEKLTFQKECAILLVTEINGGIPYVFGYQPPCDGKKLG